MIFSYRNRRLRKKISYSFEGQTKESFKNAGTGYITIPLNMDREKFIQTCMVTGMVSILLGNSLRLDHVKINQSLLNQISFPENNKQLGSLIVWVNLPEIDYVTVISVLNKNSEVNSISNDNQFQIKKELKGNIVEIFGDVKKGKLSINIDSIKEDFGEIDISVNNKNDTGVLNLNVDGEWNLNIGEINGKIKDGIALEFKDPIEDKDKSLMVFLSKEGLTILDDEENEMSFNNSEIILNTKDKVIIGKGEEVAVLGNVFKDFLSDLIDEISSATVTTSLGNMPLLNKIQIQDYKKKIDSFLSDYLKIQNNDK